MKSILCPITTLLVTCLTTLALADEPSGGEKAFKDFGEFMIGGIWTRTDEDGNELEHVYQWAAHKRCIQMRKVKDPTAGVGLITVHPQTGECIWRGFDHNAERGVTAATVTLESLGKNKWLMKGELVEEETTDTGEWTITGEGDTLRIQGQPVIKGKVQAIDVTWKRRKNTATKQEFAEFLQKLKGKWSGHVTLAQDIPGIGKKGDKKRVEAENSLTAHGDAMVSHGTDDGGGSGTSLVYYDANTHQIADRAVFSGGTIVSSVYVKEGEKWIRHVVTTDPDGKKTRATDVLVISDGGDTHTWTRGDVSNVWRRAKK